MSLLLRDIYHQWDSWFRGDFHAHTNHSDGSLTPAALLNEAREKQLDFFSITDHNLISAFDQFGEHDDMLIIPGVEVTMKYGHFNVFGIEGETPDWLQGLPSDREAYEAHMRTGVAQYTPTELMQLTKEQGLYNSINHPLLEEWAWIDGATDLRVVDFFEIWNDPSWPGNAVSNPAAVALWSAMLNAGHRLTAIGGSDFHHPEPKTQHDGSLVGRDHLNKPTTYVYAQNLSGAAILEGVKRRHAYVSMGPQLAFGGKLNDAVFMLGDDLGAASGTLQLKASATGDGALTLQIVRNGSPIVEATGRDWVEVRIGVELSAEISQWFRLDVRDEAGNYVAITNPIYCGPAITPSKNRFGDFIAPAA